MNKLTIVLSGRKQSGKSTMCNYIMAKYLNKNIQPGHQFHIDDKGELIFVHYGMRYPVRDMDNYPEIAKLYAETVQSRSVKVYSFADPLKDFCINVLGAPYESCWGTDEQKNQPIPHLLWENTFIFNHSRKFTIFLFFINFFIWFNRFWSKHIGYKTGPMTGRELLQWFGTNVCRKLYGDCWARATYNKVKTEAKELALISDMRFINEGTMGKGLKAKIIRLSRHVLKDNHESESALDNFPKENYTLFIDNSNFTLEQQIQFVDPYIEKWFQEAGI